MRSFFRLITRVAALATCVALGQGTLASEESVQSFTIDGKLYSDPNTGSPLLDTGTLTIQITDASQTCILYEETQDFDTKLSDGNFNIRVGESTSVHSKRSAGDSGHTLSSLFANLGGTISGKKISDQSACSGSLAAGSARYVRMVVNADSNPTPHAMTPFPLDSVPASWVAETLQGVGPSGFINVNNNSPAVLTQAHVENVFSTINYPILTGLLSNGANGYVQNTTNGTLALPALSGAPSSPSAGQIWYDSGSLKFWNGSSAQTLGVSGSGISSLTVGAGLTPTGTITTSGSIAVDVGTSAGQIVQVQTGGKLPALDGSNLTNLNGSAISSGTIGGTTSISTSGSVAANSANFRSLTLTNAGSQSVTLQPAATFTGSPLTFTWPGAYPGVAGFVLSSDTSGNMSWVAQSVGGLAAVSNTASLSNGKVWIGDGSGKAQEVSVTGDMALTNTGVSTVNAIKGVSVTAAPTLTGQVLRYNGTNLVPNFVSMTDLRSNVTGTTALAASCASNQTLTYSSALDNLTCTNISLPAGQVTGTLPVANGGTGAVSLGSNQLLLGNGTSAVSSLPAGSSGQMLQSAGASVPAWSAATYPSTTTANQLLYSSSANTVSGLTTANTAALVTNSSGVPSFTSGATANRVLRTDGTTVSFAQVDLTTDVTGTLPIGKGGTGSTSQTWVDLTTAQTVAGVKTWSNNAIFNGQIGVGTATPSAALHLPAGTASAGTAPLKLTAGTNLATPEPGAIEFDGSSLFYTDNSNVRHTLAAAGAGLTALTGDVTASGSGSVAATVAQVGGVTAANVASGANAANAATDVNTASTIVSRDASGNFAAGAITMGSGVLKGSASGTLTQKASAATTSYVLTWPSAVTPTSGYVLSSDTSGNLSWVAPSAGGLAAVSNTASLADGKIWIGDGTGKAQENTLSGDVSMTDTGVSTVAKVNGVAYGASPLTNTVPVVTGANTVTYEAVPIAAGGTGSTTQNFVDLTTAQTVAGVKTWSSNAIFSGNVGIGTATPAQLLDVNGSIAVNKTVTTAATDLVLEQTGDTLGTSRLRLQNRNGSNGAIFEVPGLDLVDFGFLPSSGTQANFRWEHRSSSVLAAPNSGTGEFQFIDPSGGGAGTVWLTTGKGATTVLQGNLGVGTANPGAKLEIASGTANTSGLKFTNFNSSSPTSTGQAVGVDASGNLVTVAGGGGGGTPAGSDTQVQFNSSGSFGASNYFTYNTTSKLLTLGTTGMQTDYGPSGFTTTNSILKTGGISSSATSLSFSTNDATRMTLNASGNLGIGTNAPGARLEVSSGTANTSGLKFTDFTSSAPTGTGQAVGVDASGNLITIASGGSGDFLKDGSVAMTGVFKASAGSAAAPSISFGGDLNTGFYDTSSNGVIGVSQGGSGTWLFGTGGTFASTDTNGGAQLNGGITAASNPTYAFVNATTTGIFTPGGVDLGFSVVGTEAMRISSTGNLGVGTANPGARLEVASGTANTSGLKFTNFNSSSPTSTGQAVGVDASGNLITIAASAGLPSNTLLISQVRVATGGDTTLSGLQTIDGVTLNDGDRVLVKKQANAPDNGIYTASAGAWTRASDMNTWASTIGSHVFVAEGTSFHGVEYISYTTTGGTLGTTAISFGTVASANSIVALGVSALGSNTTGTYNTAIGYAVMSVNTTSGFNTGIGYGALNKITTGNGANVAIGVSTMSANTTGYYNTAVGTNSLQYNDVGMRNTAVGYLASRNSTSASYNTTLGYSALRYNLTGSSNTAIGQSALMDSTGTGNIGLGSNAGWAINTGDNNVIIGGDSGSAIDGMSNQIILADGAGNDRIRVDGSGNVGIGTTGPSARLEVASGTANASGLKFSNFNSSSPTGTGQAIGVDASGNLITIPASGGGGGGFTSIVTTSTTPSIAASDNGKLFILTGSVSGVTLPTAASVGSGFVVSFKSYSSSNVAFSQTTLDCATTPMIGSKGSVQMVSDGTNWIQFAEKNTSCAP